MANDNSRKGFLAVTLVTIISIVAVVTVYAVLIGTFHGGDVTVGGMGSADVRYNLTDVEGGSWNDTLIASSIGTPWYSRLEIASGGYSGPVTITWQLQNKNGTGENDWADIAGADVSTSIILTADTQTVYASSDGLYATGNHNWGDHITTRGTYRVYVTVESVASP